MNSIVNLIYYFIRDRQTELCSGDKQNCSFPFRLRIGLDLSELHTVSTFWGGHFHIILAEHSQRSSFHAIHTAIHTALKACEHAWALLDEMSITGLLLPLQ